MKMISWIIGCAIQITLIRFDSLKCLIVFSNWVFLKSQNFISQNPSSWNWLYEALLIGNQDMVRANPLMQSFLILGIYHLIVVSGSHVVNVHHWTRRFTIFLPQSLTHLIVTIVLIAFTFANRLQASCVRAVIHLGLGKLFKISSLAQADLQFLTTCVCLLLSPQWVESLSFQLSSAASLGLCIAASLQIQNSFKRRCMQSLLCTLVMTPLLYSIQPCLSWLIIPTNILAAPVFEFILLPLSFLNVVCPLLRPILEPVLEILFNLTRFLSEFENPVLCFEERNLKTWGFIYVSIVYFLWRLLLPSLTRYLFWKSQRQKHN
ncbi:MAG: ComEC/Rec2 family competence protein [Oligoflexia bacterium]|nr:ComEC/Rec2 family competence protein [Oligoflexia bacterium]